MSRKVAEPLIEFLRSTGTGEAKLIAVAETADRCKSAGEFLAEIKRLVPQATVAKIETWFEKNLPAEKAKSDAVVNGQAEAAELARSRVEVESGIRELAQEREAFESYRAEQQTMLDAIAADQKAEGERLETERKKLADEKAAVAKATAELAKAKTKAAAAAEKAADTDKTDAKT
jgi:hypothetical protein